MHVSQKRYAGEVLKQAWMLNCKMISTPINTIEKLQLKDNSGNVSEKKYRRIVGGLLYLSHTRHHLMFAVGLVS